MNGSDCSAVCGSDADSRATAEFWLERVGVPLVGTAGLLGNIAAIAVLRSVAGGQLLIILSVLNIFYQRIGYIQKTRFLLHEYFLGSKGSLWR